MINQIKGYVMRVIFSLALFGICCTAYADTVLITGANSGIGLELSKQYAAEGWHVIATHRRDSIPASLAELSAEHEKVRVETLDVTDQDGIDALAKKLAGVPIDVLLNNAGIVGSLDDPKQQFGTLDYELFQRFMDTNTAGPLRTAEAFYENVMASEQKKIVAVSTAFSRTRAVSSNFPVDQLGLKNRYWYNSSKAALNMAYIVLAHDLRDAGISVAVLSPGLVRVERTSSYALNEEAEKNALDVDESAANLRKMIRELNLESSGSYISRRGVREW